ncbi:hypothetical protein BCR33DRAFT_766811 [Rhizoclosmatium globosum]|uniref:Aminopeptidase n=1 Tax=Rhizoclosmatium globosum TaxID=329046 RepID=A0A1Y2C808_9FUNG|nr:hypothetical protein BCR33DRAFT_766811 [Rhizoclosmatium globosum]|eukprot:ORY43158.1 hypothetical protein BCR33DRAFT_766811 [Rhizoclosmatium globosum]
MGSTASPHHFGGTGTATVLQYESISLLPDTSLWTRLKRIAGLSLFRSSNTAPPIDDAEDEATRRRPSSTTAASNTIAIARVRRASNRSTTLALALVALVASLLLLAAWRHAATPHPVPPLPPANSTRLPLYFNPIKYRLSITADPDKDRFAGSVSIDLDASSSHRPTTNITLHAVNLDFSKANVTLWNILVPATDDDLIKSRNSFSASEYLRDPILDIHHSYNHHSSSSNANFQLKDDPSPSDPLHPTAIIFNPSTMTVTLFFPFLLVPRDPSQPITLKISWTGEIGYRSMTGFFKSPVGALEAPKKPKYITATHFEPLAARLAFPCFDEPHLKTLWTLTIATPQEYTVVSNTAVESVTEMPTARGWNIWKFEAGKVPMSTYLVAWGIGQVDFVEGIVPGGNVPGRKKDVVVRGFVYDGVPKDDVRFSVDVAVKSLQHYETMLNTPYPMTKLDLWPMPDFSGEGMENMGLCIFHESGLFVKAIASTNASTPEEYTILSDPDKQIYVSNLVAHEVVHHWFGDLVTMKWWNNLWLNEGFAEWGQYLGTNISFPSWKIYDRFFEMEHELVFAKELGGHTRSVGEEFEKSVESIGEIVRMFDELSYNKGASILRMFDAHMATLEVDKPGGGSGSEKAPQPTKKYDCSTWCRVLRTYLNTTSFSSATPDDLYNAIDTVDESGFVSAAFQGWIEKDGVPVVWVDKEGVVKQERLLAWRNTSSNLEMEDEEDDVVPAPKKPRKPKKDEKGWFIPFVYKHLDLNTSSVEELVVNRRWVIPSQETRLMDSDFKNDSVRVMLANPGRTGLFRFRPSKADYPLLATLLNTNHEMLAPIDRAGLVSDLIALMLANYVKPEHGLPIIKYLSKERNPTVWRVAVASLTSLLKSMELHQGYTQTYQFIQSLVFPVADSIGWWSDCTIPAQPQDFNSQNLRNIILPFAATLNHMETVTTARDLYITWTKESESKPTVTPKCFQIQEDFSTLVRIVYDRAVRDDPIAAYEVLRNASRGMPGDINGVKQDVFAVSAIVSHVKELVDLGDIPAGASDIQIIQFTRQWSSRLKAVAETSGQLGVELAWESLRYARFRKHVGELGKRGSQQVLGVSRMNGSESTVVDESLWDAIVRVGLKNVDAAVEAIVAAGWKDGPIWRDAKLVVESISGQGKESAVVTAVRKGLDRADAAGKFREEVGEAVRVWMVENNGQH